MSNYNITSRKNIYIIKVIKMSNIADLIEDYILRRLAAEHNRKVELKRSDIADEISCAPSQISYVLSTRFTQDKGFVVESRRGLGGFIRIGRVPLQNLIYQDILEKINEHTTLEDVNNIVHYLFKRELIQKREAAILLQTLSLIFDKLSTKERIAFIKSLIMTLANFS